MHKKRIRCPQPEGTHRMQREAHLGLAGLPVLFQVAVLHAGVAAKQAREGLLAHALQPHGSHGTSPDKVCPCSAGTGPGPSPFFNRCSPIVHQCVCSSLHPLPDVSSLGCSMERPSTLCAGACKRYSSSPCLGAVPVAASSINPALCGARRGSRAHSRHGI